MSWFMDQADRVGLNQCVSVESNGWISDALVRCASVANQMRGKRPRSARVTPIAPGSASASRWTPFSGSCGVGDICICADPDLEDIVRCVSSLDCEIGNCLSADAVQRLNFCGASGICISARPEEVEEVRRFHGSGRSRRPRPVCLRGVQWVDL